MTPKDKIDYIVLLRVVAIILVVFAHATRSIHSPNHHMYNPAITPLWEIVIKDYIYSFHMPLFFWISGFVFYFSAVENRKKDSIVKQILNKAKRLLLPMYLTSFLILFPTIFFFGHMNESMVSQTKLFLLCLDIDHLWFLRDLIMIFLAIIPLYYYSKSDNKTFYAIIFILWCLLYTYNPLIPQLIKSPTYYFPFFIIGCLSRKHEHSLQKMNFIFLFSMFFLIHFLVLLAKKTNIIHIPEDCIRYVTAFFGIYYMYYIARIAVKYLKSKKFWSIIREVDARSYSIYLFHVSFLYLVLFIDFHLETHIAALRIAFSFITGLFLSMLLHDLFANNKILSKAFAIPYKKET